MTESEWLSCEDPGEMLAYLRGRASDRKLRLFAVACCRRGWDRITVPEIREVVEGAERDADRPTAEGERLDAYFYGVAHPQPGRSYLPTVAWPDAWLAASTVSLGWQGVVEGRRRKVRHRMEQATQSGLLRCIFGNPFRPISIAPAVLAWQGGTVTRMATAIYNDHRWEDMPLLGDCLEDAGCSDSDLLAHCRGPGPHARGCFVVDAILGKE